MNKALSVKMHDFQRKKCEIMKRIFMWFLELTCSIKVELVLTYKTTFFITILGIDAKG